MIIVNDFIFIKVFPDLFWAQCGDGWLLLGAESLAQDPHILAAVTYDSEVKTGRFVHLVKADMRLKADKISGDDVYYSTGQTSPRALMTTYPDFVYIVQADNSDDLKGHILELLFRSDVPTPSVPSEKVDRRPSFEDLEGDWSLL